MTASAKTTKQTILVADDERSIVMLIKNELELVGYRVLVAENGTAATKLAEQRAPDLIILDIMMPGKDGFAVCREIREFSYVPIIMLSARGQEQDKVYALNLGADDYMTKPFGIGELIARVNAAMRRTRRSDVAPDAEPFASGPIAIDYSARQVSVEGRPVKLTATEYKLLCTLAKRSGKTILHDAILSAVWGPEYVGQVEYLWVYMGRLRHKLELDPENPKVLVSAPGVGYRMENI